MKNRWIADMFNRMAEVLEFQGESPFKTNAYRKAGRILGELQSDVEVYWKEGRLKDIPGIGEGLAGKIDEFLRTGKMAKYDEIVGAVPRQLIDLLEIQNIGPKTLALAQRRLGVRNLDDLKKTIEDGSLTGLPGMGPKKVDNIRKGIELFEQGAGRIPLGVALPLAQSVVRLLKSHPGIGRISPAGSLRRMREHIGDIDILIETDRGEEAVRRFVSLPMVSRVLASGSTRGSVLVENGIQVDVRAVESGSYGAALLYFTGSKEHNVRLRELAKRLGYKINEYGIFKGEKKLGGETEEEIYGLLGMSWIPPELREDRGEIEAAAGNHLPHLVGEKDVLSDLHVHTNWSDGLVSIEAMAEKARSLGYRFLAVCDHSASAAYAKGLNPERLLKQIKTIRNLNTRFRGFRILAGTEADILSDGSLDVPEKLLSELDIVVAAVHTGFKQRVTGRLVSAAGNPHVDVLAHPTGRLISRREGYEVDLEAVMKSCAETGTAMEINAWFERLDLNDANARRAKEMGIPLSIGTDAHRPEHMDAMTLGIGVARRAWLEKQDVLNCFDWKKRKK